MHKLSYYLFCADDAVSSTHASPAIRAKRSPRHAEAALRSLSCSAPVEGRIRSAPGIFTPGLCRGPLHSKFLAHTQLAPGHKFSLERGSGRQRRGAFSPGRSQTVRRRVVAAHPLAYRELLGARMSPGAARTARAIYSLHRASRISSASKRRTPSPITKY